jgi:hypothetical protein
MRIVVLAAACVACGTTLAQGQQAPAVLLADDCAPVMRAIDSLVPVHTVRCGALVQSFLTESGSEFAGSRTTLVLQNDGAVRALQNAAEPPATLVFPGGVTHYGAEGGVIYWGQWTPGPIRRFEGESERGSRVSRGAMPYVGGIPTRMLIRPGVADYELLGEPFVISRHFGNPDIVTDTDYQGNVIEPGPIGSASLRVDFAAGTAMARLRYSVRSVSTETRLELRRRNPTSLTFDSVDCGSRAVDTCPYAELRFYGAQGDYAGMRFELHYNGTMSEPQRVAARLNNVRGFGTAAFKRH